jgi:hypothetical protein
MERTLEEDVRAVAICRFEWRVRGSGTAVIGTLKNPYTVGTKKCERQPRRREKWPVVGAGARRGSERARGVRARPDEEADKPEGDA